MKTKRLSPVDGDVNWLIETVRGVERDRLREKRGRLSEGVEERKAGVWGRSRDSEKEMQRS